jgi:hypothetical protein
MSNHKVPKLFLDLTDTSTQKSLKIPERMQLTLREFLNRPKKRIYDHVEMKENEQKTDGENYERLQPLDNQNISCEQFDDSPLDMVNLCDLQKSGEISSSIQNYFNQFGGTKKSKNATQVKAKTPKKSKWKKWGKKK